MSCAQLSADTPRRLKIKQLIRILLHVIALYDMCINFTRIYINFNYVATINAIITKYTKATTYMKCDIFNIFILFNQKKIIFFNLRQQYSKLILINIFLS